MITLTKEISEKQFDWRNDSRINAFTRQNGILSQEDMIKWRKKISEDSSIQMFGIIEPSGQNIGTCGLTSISTTHGNAEFSLLISPQYQSKGYGKSALVELLKYGFKNLRLNLIWGETFQGNHALNMFLKLGMKLEGRLNQRYFKNGEYLDSYLISITEKEAREQKWWNG